MATSGYTSTTDRAAIIRAAYKKHGWNSRDISVRAESFSMGSAIRVRINNPAVAFAEARAIAEGHESIRRDHFGEILGGGNRYVSVGYSHEAEQAIEAQYAEVLHAAEQAIKANESDSSLHPIGDTGYLLGRSYNGYGYSLWKDGHIQDANEARHLAATLHARTAVQ